MRNLLIAAAALALFHLVCVASGRLQEHGGLGWDGRMYARMVTGDLSDGSRNTQMRPLLVLATRIPYRAGLDLVTSFRVLNYVYAFSLFVAASLLLERYGADLYVRAIVAANLAMCIATAKMFAFYPVQLDLGALALATVAFWLVTGERRRSAAIACVLAAAAREFGVLVAVFAIHRTLRRGRGWREAAMYFPALAMPVLLRLWIVSAPVDGERPPLTIVDAIENLELLGSAAFILVFVYFASVLFGGISTVLALRARWCFERFRNEPELATYAAPIVLMSLAGSLDIWRYLVFTLPVALVLIAGALADYDRATLRRVLIAMTLTTVVTQRPFEQMDTALYFRDWFPLYRYFDGREALEPLTWVWAARVASLALIGAGLWMTMRQVEQRPA